MIMLHHWVEVDKLNRQNRKQFEKDLEKVSILGRIDRAINEALKSPYLVPELCVSFYHNLFQDECKKLKPSRFFDVNPNYIEETYGFAKAPDPSYKNGIKILEHIRKFVNR
jgi:hypothetical protein